MKKIFTGLIITALLLSVNLTAYAEESGAVVTLNEEIQADNEAVVVDWGAASPAAGNSVVNDSEQSAQPYFSEQPNTVTQTESPPYIPSQSGFGNAVGIYPQNVETVTENGTVLIKKTYEISTDVNPETLVQPFDQDGFRFTKREILRRDLPGETLSRLAFKTAETDTDSDDATLIAWQFPDVIEHEEDGYTGQLQLDASTLSTVAASHESYSYPYTKTREIPGLERNDPAYIDKHWNGMVLANVSFKQSADGRYTATATYKGTAAGKRVTGFVSTVKYSGTLMKEVPGNVLYTVIYEGALIAPVEPEAPAPSDDTVLDEANNTIIAEALEDNSPEPSVAPAQDKEYIILVLVAAIIIFLFGAGFVPLYTIKQQKKERRQNREEIEEIKRFIRGED